MKFLIALTLALPLGAFAAEDLNSMKEMANEHINSKISTLQNSKTCVNNATTTEKFKACKYDMHEDMKMQKMEMMKEKHKKSLED